MTLLCLWIELLYLDVVDQMYLDCWTSLMDGSVRLVWKQWSSSSGSQHQDTIRLYSHFIGEAVPRWTRELVCPWICSVPTYPPWVQQQDMKSKRSIYFSCWRNSLCILFLSKASRHPTSPALKRQSLAEPLYEAAKAIFPITEWVLFWLLFLAQFFFWVYINARSLRQDKGLG